MITCYLKYIIDSHKIPEFEAYAKRWIPIVNRMGGTHHGYFLPHEGASNVAYALFSFPSLAEYEDYRNRMGRQPEEREAALYKLALQPDTGIRELARVTGVSPSTASRWLKNTEFNQQLDRLKTRITDPPWRKACEDALTSTLLSDEKLNHNGGV